MTTLCFGHYTYKLRKVKRGKASGRAAGTNALKGSSVVPFTAALLRSRGKSDTSIANALQKEGYTTSEIAKILQQMNQ